MSSLCVRPRPRPERQVRPCRRTPKTRRTRTASSAGMVPCWSWSGPAASPAGILIHGLGGVGKTTLSRGLIQWLATTDGLGQGCFWFTFQDIRSAEFVFNQMVGALFGTNALAAGLDEKLEALIGPFANTAS